MTPFISAAARAFGALAAGVAASLIPAHGPPFAYYGVSPGVPLAAAVFWLNSKVESLATLRDVFIRAVLIPLGLLGVVFVLSAMPSDWDHAGYWAEHFVTELWKRTPYWAYPGALAYGAIRAQVAEDRERERHPFYL